MSPGRLVTELEFEPWFLDSVKCILLCNEQLKMKKCLGNHLQEEAAEANVRGLYRPLVGALIIAIKDRPVVYSELEAGMEILFLDLCS